MKRLNRFVAEVELNGARELAHVPSSGRMAELLYPGARVYLSGVPAGNPLFCGNICTVKVSE